MGTNDNAIHALLDGIGFPWRSFEAELVRRYGVRKDGPFHQTAVSIPTRPPLLGGLLRPMEVRLGQFVPSNLPALEFCGEISQGRDAAFNLRFAASELDPALGHAEIRKRGNVLRCDWTCGRARVELTVWPPEWQGPTTNSAHDRDPRLVTACHLVVASGFRPAPTQTELAWITAYEPYAQIRTSHAELMRGLHLEFLRDVEFPVSWRGTVGWPPDRDALIFCDDELHIIALDDILRLEVSRMLPAKGNGGSELVVVCRSRAADQTPKRLILTTARGSDDLNEMGAHLAWSLGRGCSLEPYEFDV